MSGLAGNLGRWDSLGWGDDGVRLEGWVLWVVIEKGIEGRDVM